jgi:hypothetical protein
MVVSYAVFVFPFYAGNLISAVTDFVAQLQVLELPYKVCIIIWKLAIVSIYYHENVCPYPSLFTRFADI